MINVSYRISKTEILVIDITYTGVCTFYNNQLYRSTLYDSTNRFRGNNIDNVLKTLLGASVVSSTYDAYLRNIIESDEI